MLNRSLFKTSYFTGSIFILGTALIAIPATSRAGSSVDKTLLRTASDTSLFAIAHPVKMNRKGAQFVKNYLKKSDECLVAVKKRSQLPFYIIDSVLTVYGLPVELKYLAVIESELKPSALSHVGARGPWQLMPATARVLGLKVNRLGDERTNYYKSTIAAARYLKDLYSAFDDWLLVLAAYNGGPKPVYEAIRKSGSKNFWTLQEYLPAESREHVKKFIATQYYFEGRGSETTLTKSENIAYLKTVKAFTTAYVPKTIVDAKTTEKTNSATIRKNLIVHSTHKHGKVRLGDSSNNHNDSAATGPAETSAQKFKRLMKESEECLKSSKKLIKT